MRQWKLVALSAALVTISACGGSGSSGGNLNTGPGPTPTPTPTPPSTTVTLANLAFNPGSLSVSVGATVTWTWNDCGGSGGYGPGTCVQHGVVFDDGSGIVSPIQDTGTFTRTFNTAGTFNYHCAIHGAAMTGKIIVS